MEQENNKFNEAEIVIGCMFVGGVDVVCLLIELTGIGVFISAPLQSFVTFGLWWWFKSKGGERGGNLGKQIAKYFANVLPMANFVAFIIQVIIHNNPKVAQLTGQLAGGAVGAAVGGPAGARVGAAVGQYEMGGSAADSAMNALPSTIPLKK